MTKKTIQSINAEYNYEDTHPGGKRDSSLVSCGQCGNYNELQYIFEEVLEPFIDEGKFTETEAVDALDKACAEVESPRNRQVFYKFLSKELGVQIK